MDLFTSLPGTEHPIWEQVFLCPPGNSSSRIRNPIKTKASLSWKRILYAFHRKSSPSIEKTMKDENCNPGKSKT